MNALKIERLAAGGDGVGRLADGMVVFVPRTAPGDEVEIALEERHRRYARGRLIRLLRPSADRCEPRCPHYEADRCGGCQLQHLSLAAQQQAKRTIVGEALRRIGRRAVEDPPLVGSAAAWRYRTKVTLAQRGTVLGFHRYDRPEEVFPLVDCLIASERLMQLWGALRPHLAALPQPLTEVVLREGRDGALHVVASGGSRAWDARILARRVGLTEVCYWWRPPGGAARVVAGPRTGFPVTAFQQSNPALAAQLRLDAVAALGGVEGLVVWDLYAGVGDTARLLAERGAQVVAVERDRGAVEWGRRHLPAELGVRFLVGRVEESLHRLPNPSAVVVNPPRTGLAARVSQWLEQWGRASPGARLVYVSCDPATLARDLARLPAFELERVVAYDLFPQTAHVESLAVLARR